MRPGMKVNPATLSTSRSQCPEVKPGSPVRKQAGGQPKLLSTKTERRKSEQCSAALDRLSVRRTLGTRVRRLGNPVERGICRNFFIRRPIVAMVIAIIICYCGTCRRWQAFPSHSFPNIVPPQIQVNHLRRRRRPHSRGFSGRAYRAANERRRGHGLHVFDQCQQWHDDPQCHF